MPDLQKDLIALTLQAGAVKATVLDQEAKKCGIKSVTLVGYSRVLVENITGWLFQSNALIAWAPAS